MSKLLKNLFILVIVVGGVGFYLYKTYLSAPIISAQARGDSYMVNGQTTKGAVELKKGDSVETKAQRASVYLNESVIVVLDPNSKVVIEDTSGSHPKIKQEKGTTWNQFTELNGVDSYTVMEGENSATVEGTAFVVSKDKVVVVEGVVGYMAAGKEMKVAAGKAVEKRGAEFAERIASAGEKNNSRYVQLTIAELRFIREQEISKYPKVVNRIKEQFKITDDQIKKGLLDADQKKLNVDEIVKKSPVKIAAIDRIVELTKEIQRLLAL